MRKNILKVLERNQIAEMIYMKENREFSKRKVKVLNVNKDTFEAYCFLRGAKRTFKICNVLAFNPLIKKEGNIH